MLPTVGSETSVAVIGAGSWGTTVAAIISAHAPTTLWGRDAALVAEINDRHENARYLAGIELPVSLCATDDLEAACEGYGTSPLKYRLIMVNVRLARLPRPFASSLV